MSAAPDKHRWPFDPLQPGDHEPVRIPDEHPTREPLKRPDPAPTPVPER